MSGLPYETLSSQDDFASVRLFALLDATMTFTMYTLCTQYKDDSCQIHTYIQWNQFFVVFFFFF